MLAGSFFLSACTAIDPAQQFGSKSKLPSDKNIGTKNSPAFSTGGISSPDKRTWPSPGSVIPPKLTSRLNSLLENKSVNWKRINQEMANSWAHGLDPSAYKTNRQDEYAAALIRYLSDLRYGLTKPNFGNVVNFAAKIAHDPDPQQALSNAAPQGYLYQRLHQTAQKSLRRSRERTGNFRALQVTFEKIKLSGEPDLSSRPVIAVNIATFDLQAYNQGKIELGSKVIVGQEGRDSPVGRDYISNLKFSPDWTVPRSIIKRTLFQKLVEKPESFKATEMEVKLNGKIIDDVTTIDWTTKSANQVQMRQLPGPKNALGGVRFSLNNANSIFLHDTNTPQLFDKNVRAISSGCIRVQKPTELAHWILQKDGQTDWDVDRIKEAMTRGKINYAKLKKRMHVELLYHQAWVDHQGVLRLGGDIYNRDLNLQNKISALST